MFCGWTALLLKIFNRGGYESVESGSVCRFAGIRDTRSRRAISRSLAPTSISSAVACRTRLRRVRAAVVSPPPSECLMVLA